MANLPRNSAVLVLAWPEVTARGEEGIIKFLRTIGVVKNVNMMVGHAAMMIAEGSSLRYYDLAATLLLGGWGEFGPQRPTRR